VYVLHSYMTDLNFITDPPFYRLDEVVNDAAFVKATCTIGGQDAMEEYMTCGLLLLSVSFGLGEVANGEMSVSKLPVPM
jgi:hypothetical protein